MKRKLLILLYFFMPATMLCAQSGSTVYEAEDFISTGGPASNVQPGFQPYTTPSGIQAVNYIQTYDYGLYDVNVDYSGTYRVRYYLATTVDGAAIQFGCNGLYINDFVPNNHNWDLFQPLESSGTIELLAGQVNQVSIKGVGTNGWEWNFDRFELIPVTIYAVDINLESDEINLEPGHTFSLNGSILPAEATNQQINYSSDNSYIATVNASGVITAVNEGSAVITATSADGHAEKTCMVTVQQQAYSFIIEAENFGNYNGGFETYNNNTLAHMYNNEIGMIQLPPYYPDGQYKIELLVADVQSNVSVSLNFFNAGFDNIIIEAPLLTDETSTFNWVALEDTAYLDYARIGSVILSSIGSEGVLYNFDKIRFTRIGDLNVPVNEISAVTDTVITVGKDNYLNEIKVQLNPGYATNQNVTWSSSNTGVVTIDETGYIYTSGGGRVPEVQTGLIGNYSARAVDVGVATITATTEDGNFTQSFEVTVNNPVTEVIIEPQTVQLIPGARFELEASVMPEDATDDALVWTSDDHTVGFIQVYGRAPWYYFYFIAVNEGTTYVKATNISTGLADSIRIEVKVPENSLLVEAEDYSYLMGDFSVATSATRSYLTTGLGASSGYSQYQVNAPEAGTYQMIYNYSNKGGSFNVTINSNSYSHVVPDLNNLNTPAVYSNYSAGTVELAEGNNTVTIMYSGANYFPFPYNVDYYMFLKVEPVDSIVIEAESFVNTNGIFNDAPYNGPGYGVNNAGTIINYVNSGDTADYTVEVPVDGEYEITYYISTPANNAEITSYVDDELISVDAVPNNNSWDNYQPLVASSTANLTAGTVTFRLVASGINTWQWNLDYIVLKYIGSSNKKAESLTAAAMEIPFSVYPTVVEDYFNVEFMAQKNVPYTISIYNASGQLQELILNNQNLETGVQFMEHSIGNLTSGTYYIKLSSPNQTQVKSIIVR